MEAPKKYAKASLLKVGENLYRNESSGTYYALVKRSGKQTKRSLKTKDLALAKRRLREFAEKVDRINEPYRPTIAEGVPIAGPKLKYCLEQLLGYQPSIFSGANLAYSD
jgi:hypothetical protein